MARKGRSDAGKRRKPENNRKTVVLTVRVDASTKADLERARAVTGKTLGQEIQRRLVESVGKHSDLWGNDDRNYRLGVVIANCIQWVHVETGAHWRDDAWTYDALVGCVGQVLQFLAERGERHQPERVKATLANLERINAPEILKQMYGSPAGVGQIAAQQVIAGLLAAGKDFNSSKMNELPYAGHVLGVKLVDTREPQS